MRLLQYSTFILSIFLIATSCSGKSYRFKLNTSQKTTLGDKASITLEQVSGEKVDSIHIYVDDKKLATDNYSATLNTANLGVGKHAVTALAFYPGKVKKVNNYIEVFSNKVPELYSYKIVNEYPHDKKAYTQGLEFHNDFLYETTGRRGESWLRKVDYKTGKVLQQKDLSNKYFGEGMTIFNDSIFWLTWQAGIGLIYNLNDFEQKGEFKYNKSLQGWGLTHNDKFLIKSDGTSKIWFLNPETQKENHSIQAYTNKVALEKLNELEWVNGKIYANYWQKPLIAIINPDNGIVEGIINLTGLVKEMKKTQQLVDEDDVLNGIAYHAKENRLFVTGKHWSKLFEIELVKK